MHVNIRMYSMKIGYSFWDLLKITLNIIIKYSLFSEC